MVKIFTIEDIQLLKELSKVYPNDFDLGGKVRSLYRDSDVSKDFNNDADLGNQIRKMIK
jgi:hypothetical protein